MHAEREVVLHELQGSIPGIPSAFLMQMFVRMYSCVVMRRCAATGWRFRAASRASRGAELQRGFIGIGSGGCELGTRYFCRDSEYAGWYVSIAEQ